MRFADANHHHQIDYATELINDTTPPEVNNVGISLIDGQTATLPWSTNEYTTSLVEYGIQSGNYTESLVDDWYRKNHSLTLTGLNTGAFYFSVSPTQIGAVTQRKRLRSPLK